VVKGAGNMISPTTSHEVMRWWEGGVLCCVVVAASLGGA